MKSLFFRFYFHFSLQWIQIAFKISKTVVYRNIVKFESLHLERRLSAFIFSFRSKVIRILTLQSKSSTVKVRLLLILCCLILQWTHYQWLHYQRVFITAFCWRIIDRKLIFTENKSLIFPISYLKFFVKFIYCMFTRKSTFCDKTEGFKPIRSWQFKLYYNLNILII